MTHVKNTGLCTILQKHHARQCPLVPDPYQETLLKLIIRKIGEKCDDQRSWAAGPRMEELQIIFYKQPPRCWRLLIAVSRSSCWKEEGEIWCWAQAAPPAGCQPTADCHQLLLSSGDNIR